MSVQGIWVSALYENKDWVCLIYSCNLTYTRRHRVGTLQQLSDDNISYNCLELQGVLVPRVAWPLASKAHGARKIFEASVILLLTYDDMDAYYYDLDKWVNQLYHCDRTSGKSKKEMFMLANRFRVFQVKDGPIMLVSVAIQNWLFWVCVLLEYLSLPTMTLLSIVLRGRLCPNPDFPIHYSIVKYSSLKLHSASFLLKSF